MLLVIQTYIVHISYTIYFIISLYMNMSLCNCSINVLFAWIIHMHYPGATYPEPQQQF